jgi:hypothetical protein
LEKLGDTEHAEVGSELAGQIQKKIALIDNTQKAKILNIRQKMNLFYENTISLNTVKEDIGMLENLVLDVGGVLEEKKGGGAKKTIFIIIGFVAIVSVISFALWHTQVRQERRKKEERK